MNIVGVGAAFCMGCCPNIHNGAAIAASAVWVSPPMFSVHCPLTSSVSVNCYVRSFALWSPFDKLSRFGIYFIKIPLVCQWANVWVMLTSWQFVQMRWKFLLPCWLFLPVIGGMAQQLSLPTFLICAFLQFAEIIAVQHLRLCTMCTETLVSFLFANQPAESKHFSFSPQ